MQEESTILKDQMRDQKTLLEMQKSNNNLKYRKD
jgi:hypothetical protein